MGCGKRWQSAKMGSGVPILEDPDPLVTMNVSAPRTEDAMHGDTLIEGSSETGLLCMVLIESVSIFLFVLSIIQHL